MNYIYADEELYHHGILGQKWGIRRYQNYDGSYTKAGMKRYNAAKDKYDSAKNEYKSTKAKYKAGEVDKYQLKRSKTDLKDAKKDLNKHYKHLKQDKLADQGKELYSKNKRINTNYSTTEAIGIGTSVAAYLLNEYSNQTNDPRYKNYAAYTAVGGTVLAVGKTVVDEYQNKRLRAYYAHTSNY